MDRYVIPLSKLVRTNVEVGCVIGRVCVPTWRGEFPMQLTLLKGELVKKKVPLSNLNQNVSYPTCKN